MADDGQQTTDGGGRTGVPASGLRPPTSDRRLGMYDYLYGGGFLIPRIHTQLLAENLRHARQVGFTDYYAEVYANWGLDGPMPWLTAQLLQDPEQSVTALLDEYYVRYFREAAAPMRRFFERCEELWMAQPGPPYWLKHFRNQSQAVVFPVPAVRELRQLIDAAQRDASFGRTRARVQQVSAALGVTERFLGFQAARDQVKRLALAASPAATELAEALEGYLEERRAFVRYVTELQRADPLAVRRFGWDDYLKDDPLALALFAMWRAVPAGTAVAPPGGGSIVGPPLAGGPKGGSESRSEKGPATSAGPTILDEPNVAALWQAISSEENSGGIPATADRPPSSGLRQLLRNPAMTGDVRPGRVIAGLPYGVALPPEWRSQVEPSQFHRAELVGDDKERAVRISGTKDTTVSQWAPMPAVGSGDRDAMQQSAITVRGRVSPGTAVHLVFSWLDAKERHLGFKMVRLPDGDWPEWVTLRQAGVPPAGAAWVGLGLRIQNQVAGDWVEARDFGVTEIPGTGL